MRNSTIVRSNLSKEKIAVLEALSKFKNKNIAAGSLSGESINSEPQVDGTPEVYVRQNKEKELDMLWQNFKMPRVERSPIIYLGAGFVSGIVATVLVTTLIGLSAGEFHPKFGINVKKPAIGATEKPQKSSKINFLPSNNSENTEAVAEQKADEEYVVQSGDTMEAIVRRFYGTYSEEKVNAIMKANNMSNPNKLAIDQKLIIPMGNTSVDTSAEVEE